MDFIIREVSDLSLVRRACEMTMHGQESKVSLASMYRCEHSPIRTRLFWIEMRGIPSFVSVHLVRHKIGVEHFVQSMRDDRRPSSVCPHCSGSGRVEAKAPFEPGTLSCPACNGSGKELVDRMTPVNHGMLINAQALINMSRKRRCLQASEETRTVWRGVFSAVRSIDPELASFMVPECVYRGGRCYELRPCKAGPERIGRLYQKETTRE